MIKWSKTVLVSLPITVLSTAVCKLLGSFKHLKINSFASHLHSKPVELGASFPLVQLEAANFKSVEETVAHHVGDGVITSAKTLLKSNREKNI